jgi:hypothetical protein
MGISHTELQEGWMEMPELYGSAYVLPAIIVVVLLVALLAILLLRKKKGTGAVRTADGVTAKVAGAVTVSPPLGMTPKETPAADSSSDVPPNPPRQRQSVLDDAAVTRLAGLRDGSTSFADPLRAVIVDILQGWGELTAEDTKRLEVFRPDKVRAAVETVELPKEAKTGKYAQTRLAQLRHYAADLEVKTKKLEAEAAAVPPEPAPVTEPAMEPDAEVEVEPVVEPKEEPASQPASATAEAGEQVREPAVPAATVEAAALWPEPNAPWLLEEEHTLEEVAPAFEETVAAEETPAFEGEPAFEQSPVFLGEAPIFEATPPESDYTFADANLLAARTRVPEDSLSSLHLKIKTADDLMALPAAERADMVVFLEPSELAKVFEAAQDPDLKKAIIDMLEHVGNPTSLDVLRRCLDDPDPEIEVYALEAADRLLGVD